MTRAKKPKCWELKQDSPPPPPGALEKQSAQAQMGPSRGSHTAVYSPLTCKGQGLLAPASPGALVCGHVYPACSC